MRNGCASGQLGNVFVLKRECTSPSALSSRSSVQLGIEATQLVGREHALVDDDPRSNDGKYASVSCSMRLRAMYTCRSSVVAVESVLRDEHLLERGHQLSRALARHVRRRPAPSRQPRTSKPSSASTFSTSIFVAAVLSAGQERDAGRVRARGREVEVDDLTVEAVGRLDEDARAVAGVGLGAGRAAVVQAADRGERLVDDRVAGATLHVDDEADTARVVLEARVVQRRKLAFAFAHSSVVLRVEAVRTKLWNWPPRDDIGPLAEMTV